MQPYSPLVEAPRRAESFEHHDSLYEYIPGFRSHTMCNSDGPNASLALSGGMCMRWARNKNRELSCFLPSGYSLFILLPIIYVLFLIYVLSLIQLLRLIYLLFLIYVRACVSACVRVCVCACGAEKGQVMAQRYPCATLRTSSRGPFLMICWRPLRGASNE